MKIKKPLQYAELINGKRVVFYGNTVDEIVSDVMRIRNLNGVKTPEFNKLYNAIKPKVKGSIQVDGPGSAHYDREVKGKTPRNDTRRSRSVSINDASRAARALMKIIPGEYASEDEYKRRLAICATCPLRQRNSDCMGCGGSGRAARTLMSFRAKLGLGYQLDNKVGAEFCGFCGCSLSLLLVTKVENYKLESEETNSERPYHCWLRRDSKNYVG